MAEAAAAVRREAMARLPDGQVAIEPKEVERFLGISRALVYASLNDGSLPAKRLGDRWLVPLVLLEEWLASPDNRRAA